MRTLGLLRGIAAIAVVAHHAAQYGITALTYWAHRFDSNLPVPNFTWLGTATEYGLTATIQLTIFSVPLFLFASGFFVGYATRGNRLNATWPVIRGWLKWLLWPFAVWMAISTLLYVLEVKASPTGRLPEVASFLAQRFNQYGFVTVIAQLLLLAPALVWLTAKHPRLLLGFSVASTVTNSVLYYGLYFDYVGITAIQTKHVWSAWSPFAWLSPAPWLLYFALGLALSTAGEPVRARLRANRRLLIAGLVLVAVLALLESEFIHGLDQRRFPTGTAYQAFPEMWKASSVVYTVIAVVTFYAWDWGRGSLQRLLERLGTYSYAVFLAQFAILEYGTKVVYHMAPQLFAYQLIFQVVLVGAGVGIPALLMSLAATNGTRRYRKYVFGS